MLKTRRVALLCLALAALWPALRTDAHPMPESLVWLDVHPDGIQAELRLPVDALAKGFGHPLRPDVRQRTAHLRDSLSTYIGQHIALSSDDGRPWNAKVQQVEVVTEDDHDEVRATVWFAAPDGTVPTMLTLQYDVIIHQLRSHKALVAIRNDETRGIQAEDPAYIGRLTWHTSSIAIDRSRSTEDVWRAPGMIGTVAVVMLLIMGTWRTRRRRGAPPSSVMASNR
ncbi:MAG: hypothetical protein AAF730_04450 [Bacteroidota bacterium]